MDSLESSRAEVRARLEALRRALRAHELDAWIVPSADPHLSEYLPPRWQGRQWLSGFTGSAGLLIVTPVFAGLWVDSRYWVQAETQLAGTGINVMKVGGANSQAHADWLAENVPAGGRVGADGAVLGLAQARTLEEKLAPRGITLVTDLDLLDEVWPDRPGLPTVPIYEHAAAYAPVSRREKLAGLRAEMKKAGADWHLICTLDDIAWLTNLRGGDVPFNPVFVAFALIGAQEATLFVAEPKVPAELRARLLADGFAIAPYAQAAQALSRLPAGSTLLVDPRRITLGMRRQVPAAVRVIEAINPTTLAKSRKTEAEIAHVRHAMELDGAALADFFAWFEAALARGDRITELTIDERITAARARRPGFVCPSFATIAAFNANGALPHYHAGPRPVQEGEPITIDWGAEIDGYRSDLTRTIVLGQADAKFREVYDIVLKAQLTAINNIKAGITGKEADAFARDVITAAGYGEYFGHSLGHGVGLATHEGPRASFMADDERLPIGALITVEPGIYLPGWGGVRIEDMIVVTENGVEVLSHLPK